MLKFNVVVEESIRQQLPKSLVFSKIPSQIELNCLSKEFSEAAHQPVKVRYDETDQQIHVMKFIVD